MRELARARPQVAVALLGDSITQGLTGSTDRFARAGGAARVDAVVAHRGTGEADGGIMPKTGLYGLCVRDGAGSGIGFFWIPLILTIVVLNFFLAGSLI